MTPCTARGQGWHLGVFRLPHLVQAGHLAVQGQGAAGRHQLLLRVPTALGAFIRRCMGSGQARWGIDRPREGGRQPLLQQLGQQDAVRQNVPMSSLKAGDLLQGQHLRPQEPVAWSNFLKSFAEKRQPGRLVSALLLNDSF